MAFCRVDAGARPGAGSRWWSRWAASATVLAVLGLNLLRLGPAAAAAASPGHCGVPAPRSPSAPPVDAVAYEVMDAPTGRVLAAAQANQPVLPASLTKLATLDLALQALGSHRVRLSSAVPIDANVRQLAATPGITLMGLGIAGPSVSLRDLLLGMTLRSGNDAALAVADYLGGGVGNFVARMNALAGRLGMHDTHFGNPNGLPAPGQVTTAADMALLARHIVRHHPNFTRFTARQVLEWDGLTLSNLLDPLLGCDPRIVGAKGGWLPQSGYNLVAVARAGGRTLVVVALGSPTFAANVAAVERLADWGFADLARSRPPTGLPGVAADTGLTFHTLVRTLLPGPQASELAVASASGTQDIVQAGRRLTLPGRLPPGVPPPRWVPGTTWLVAGQASRWPAAGPAYKLIGQTTKRVVSIPPCAARSGVQPLPRAVAWFCGHTLDIAAVGASGLGRAVPAAAASLPSPPPVPGGFVVAPSRSLVAVRTARAVSVFSLPAGRRIGTVPAPAGRAVRMTWSADDVLAVAAGDRLSLWSAAAARVIRQYSVGPGTVALLAWRPDGSAVVAVAENRPGAAALTDRVVLASVSGGETTLAAGRLGYVLAVDPGSGLLWREEGVAEGVYAGRPGDGPFTLWAVRLQGLATGT